MRLLTPAEQHGTRGQHRHGDEPEGGFQAAAEGRGNAQPKRADAVAEVAPEAVDADRRGAPVGVRDVAGRFIADWTAVRHAELDCTALKLMLEGIEVKRRSKRYRLLPRVAEGASAGTIA